jgi:Putative Ig domain/FG-GAP repeat
MLEPTGSHYTTIGRPMASGVALRARAAVPWQAPVAVVLLSLALAAALYGGLNGGRDAVPSVSARWNGLSKESLLSLPLAARGPVSAALGAHNPAYRVRASGGGFQAKSPTQHLQASFGASGVVVSSGKAQVAVSLRAVGYGVALRKLARVSPAATANRVSYAYHGLEEWYANGPLGLEQGFTISRAAAFRSSATLTLSLALSGNAQASLTDHGQNMSLSQAGKTVLRYSGLLATDARGRLLRSWLALAHGQLLLHVNARGARYPLQIDPFIQQGKKLTGGSEEIGQGELGYPVALSSDGNTALIGVSSDNGGVGAAWVFVRSGGTWSQQGKKLTGAEEIGNGEFGFGVALSADGSTALIGGSNDNPRECCEGKGAAWVFTRSGGTWSQQGKKLTGAEEIGNGEFGWSVALSSDGDTALIGGLNDNTNVGAAWVFTRSGEIWSQQGKKLTGSEEIGGGGFGGYVALSSDGNAALIGGAGDNHSAGAGWMFTRSGEIWSQQGKKLTSGEVIGEGVFGSSLALSADGNTALIGGWNDNSAIGAAWVFTRSSSSEELKQQGKKLTGGEESGAGQFGLGAALSSDGNTALIGGPNDSGAGAAWVFTRSGETWSQHGKKLTGGEERGEGRFGVSVALSSDANTALIGGAGDNSGVGGAWVFTNLPTLEILTTTLPDATRGVGYEADLLARGGVPPYKWKKVGKLPKGLKLIKTGVIEGTPSSKLAPGSYLVGVKVTDSEKPKKSATANLTFKVN